MKINDINLLNSIFGNKLLQFGVPLRETIPYFLGRLAISSENPEKQCWGYDKVREFISEEKNYEILNKLYDFILKNI